MKFDSDHLQSYFNECIENNDLMIFGIYDTKQDYGIFHKWGRSAHVENIVNVMKRSITAQIGYTPHDVYITYNYPDFTMEEFDKILHCSGYFGIWYKNKVGIK